MWNHVPHPPADSRVQVIDFPVRDHPIDLFFRRSVGTETRPPVLLIHGGSASGDTFLAPAGKSLVDFLVAEGFDVWLLEWRASHYIADAQPAAANQTLDVCAKADMAEAVEFVCTATGAEQIAVLAHCLGAACFAMAVGAGDVPARRISRLVLSTIGLFYEVAWDGWAKTQDRILDRVAAHNPPLSISPNVVAGVWPDIIEQTYDMWPQTWGPPWRDNFFKRLAFLFGQPFLASNLHPAMTQDVVRGQFGSIPFTLFQHAGQNALRGFAGAFDAEGRLDPATPNARINHDIADTYVRPERFRGIDLTLITGGENPLWHRDSVDRMSEWLSRYDLRPCKFVLDGFGHQDLWWGRTSWTDVFPLVARACHDSRGRRPPLDAQVGEVSA
jgi:pimeloyl-ACP methyl ester carboxylesterase